MYLLKSILPSYLISLSTASSSAAFESNLKISNTKLGVKKELSSFGIPFGMVVFKPTISMFYMLLCFYFASKYGVGVSISWIVTAIIITSVAAISTPPIPGGASAAYTIMLLQLGLPTEALALALTVDMLFDFLITGGDMFMLLLEILRISKRLGMNSRGV